MDYRHIVIVLQLKCILFDDISVDVSVYIIHNLKISSSIFIHHIFYLNALPTQSIVDSIYVESHEISCSIVSPANTLTLRTRADNGIHTLGKAFSLCMRYFCS